MNLLIKIFSFIYFFLIFSESSAYQLQNKFPIINIEVEGLYSIKKEELLNLLNLRIGDVLDRNALSIGIKRTFLKGIFEDIVIEGNSEYTIINVKIQEKKIIDKIDITGNNYFSKRFIKNNFGITEGERINLLRIHQGIASIRAQMNSRGFPNAVIDFSIIDLKTNLCHLKLNVVEGSPEIIKNIVINGEHDIVKSYLLLSEGDIYDATSMERFKANILNYHSKQGYVDTYLKYFIKDGILYIEFNRGRKLDISFIGNESISEKTLMRELIYYEAGEFNSDIVEEMKSRLLSAYHRVGFPFVSIIPIISEAPDTISLNFYIFEGSRYRIREINFKGTSIPQESLLIILRSKQGEPFDFVAVESDRDTLKEFLNSLGYLEAEILKPDILLTDNFVDISFVVIEGSKTVISKISFLNNKSFTDKELLEKIPLKVGNPFNEVDISDSRQKIQNLYSRAGFTKARVSVESIFSENNAEIEFIIDEGSITYFGKNIIVGNERTKLNVIERELENKEGKPLNYSLVLKEKHQLQKLGLFRDVEVSLSDYTLENQRDIIYYLDEANHGIIELGVGYGEYERYRFFLDLSYKNLWGMNRLGSLRTELSTLEQRVILSYSDPWYLLSNHKFALKSLLLFENRKEKSFDTKDILYKLRRTSASAGIEKNINTNVKADLYYIFSVVNTTDVKPDIILTREDVGTLIISGIKSGLIYDTRDNPFDPAQGMLIGLSLKIASSLFLSETDFVKLNFYLNKYLRLSERIVLAASLSSGIAKGFGNTTELPIVERFFLGGRTSVRGYAQDMLGPKGVDGNPTGGNIFAMGNIEFRTNIGKGVGLVNFLDIGNVWQKLSQVDMSKLKFTAGIGLRYKTPVGPIRVDYGIKLNREPRESRGELHFSLGHAF